MPRIARKDIKVSYIHVITQGINKENIFKEVEYKKEYIELIQEVFEEYNNLYLLCYCIMDNHAHFLIYTEDNQELSKAMARVNTAYGIFYNKRKERVGYVFRNRYYTQPIKDEAHLYNAMVYIHNNPVKAKMVKEIGKYRYSSYQQYKNGMADKRCVELLFHTEDYRKIFDFIHKNFKGKDIFDIDEPKENRSDIENFLKKFCEKWGVTKEEIKKNNYLIIQIMTQLKNEYFCSNKEISEVLEIGKNRITNILKKENKEGRG